MKVDEKTARQLAVLSNIDLSDDELKSLTADLGRIVEYIGELGQLDTTGVEPTYQVTGLANVWCEDVVQEQLPRDELLELAPKRTKTAMKVPKVL